MISPYEKCPIYENENYLLRFIEVSDVSDLLSVYSDEKAVPFFNSDNCNGNFPCTLLEHVQGMIEAWQWEYKQKGFVRWSIIDKKIQHAIGTIELFNCQMIATKVSHFASNRKLAVEQLGFTASMEKLIGGHDRKTYTNYYVLKK